MPNGWKVRKILAENDMTQADLARVTGMSESNVCRIVKGNRNVREKTLWRICKGLGCKPEDIMLED